MTNFDEVRAEFFDELGTALAAAQPGVPICFENQKFNQPNDAPWFYVSLLPGDSRRAEISSARAFYHWGVIKVDCLSPPDKGTKKLHEMTQAVFDTLADRQWSLPSGSLTTYCCKRKNRGLMNGTYGFSITTEFRHSTRTGHP